MRYYYFLLLNNFVRQRKRKSFPFHVFKFNKNSSKTSLRFSINPALQGLVQNFREKEFN